MAYSGLDGLCVSVIVLKSYSLLITGNFPLPGSWSYSFDLAVMSFSSSIGSKLLLLGLLARVTLTQDNPCITFGVDFQDGGSYFQNSLSTDPFTFVQEFEGEYGL